MRSMLAAARRTARLALHFVDSRSAWMLAAYLFFFAYPAPNGGGRGDLVFVATFTVGLLVFIGLRVARVRRLAQSAERVYYAFEGIAAILLGFAVSYEVLSVHSGFLLQGVVHRLSPIEAYYFTVTTAATVGYGDIAPGNDVARGLVVLQMLVDLGAAAVLLAIAVEWLRRDGESDR
jgi:hypothetical protein